MITAEQIMSGQLPTSSREFDIEGLGRITLHRLPADKEMEAKLLFANPDTPSEKLEDITQQNTYFMLHGKWDSEEAAKLPSLLDMHQLGAIHTTGLFFVNLKQENLEALEKN